MILALLVLCLRLPANPDGGHLGFSQNGGPEGRPSWCSAKLEIVWHGGHLVQIWCFWKNVNQNIPKPPDYEAFSTI
jgi:hypothetical protein